jgi:molecular chaperone DnaK
MVQEAEANKEADEKRKELIETKNQADSLVHQTEKMLSENGDKISDEEKQKVQAAIDDTKEEIDQKVKALTEVSHKLAEAMYAKAGDQNAQGQQANQSAKKDDDDVIDAEVE